MSIQFTLAARYMRGRTLRTALTTLAVTFGVMIMFGLNGVLPGIIQSMQQAMLASAGEVDLTVRSESGATFNPALLETAVVVDGVAAATPSLRQTMSIPSESGYGLSSLLVVGVDPATSPSVRPYAMQSGRLLEAADNDPGVEPAAVTMAPDVAERLGVELGDVITLPSAEGSMELEVVGLIDIPAVPGVEEIYVPLPVAQTMFGIGDRISEIDIAIDASADRDAVEEAVTSAIGDAYSVGGISSASPLTSGFKAASFIMTVLGMFAIAMGGFIILNTFRTLVSERRHDIGMLRAIGASRRTILGTFLAESVIQGVVGTAVGLLAGWGLAVLATRALNSMIASMLSIPPANVTFTPSTWAISISFGIGVTVLAALVPARAAARLTPMEALRPQMGDVYEAAATKRAWAGLALIVLAVVGLFSGNLALAGISAVFVIVGMVLGAQVVVTPVTNVFSRAIELVYRREGGVARANLQRNPGRAAVTASTVMVSIALIIAMVGAMSSVIDGFMSYLDESMGADFLIVPQNLLLSAGAVGAGPELVSATENTDGIGDVATLRVAASAANGVSVQAIGIDPIAYPKVASFKYTEGSSEEDLAQLESDDAVLVNGVLAAQAGIKKGDTVEFQTPEGAKPFRVAGVGNDYLNAKLGTAYLSQGALERWWGVSADVCVLANAGEGADKAAVVSALQRTVDRYPAFELFDTQEWRAMQTDLFAQMKSMYFFLALMLAIPSLVALLNTLAIGVLARTREIGMLRAVGSTRKQVRRIVAAESILLAALGMTAGLIAGVWLGYVMVEALNGIGLPMPYYFPWFGVAIAVVVALAFAMLAALIPARQASKLDIVRALRFE